MRGGSCSHPLLVLQVQPWCTWLLTMPAAEQEEEEESLEEEAVLQLRRALTAAGFPHSNP